VVLPPRAACGGKNKGMYDWQQKLAAVTLCIGYPSFTHHTESHECHQNRKVAWSSSLCLL